MTKVIGPLLRESDGADAFASGGGGVTTVVLDIPALRAATWTTRPSAVMLSRFWRLGDGGAPYYWDATSVATDNGGSIIKETATATGRWIAAPADGYYTPEMYGARGDLRSFEGGAAMGAASNVLTRTGANFTAFDVGRSVWVQYGAGGGAPLVTTIASVTNSTTAVLSAPNAALDANGDPQALTNSDLCIFTDDTAAVTAVLNNHDYVRLPGRYGVTSLPPIGDGSASAPSTRQNLRIEGYSGTGGFLVQNIQRTLIRYVGAGVLPIFVDIRGPIKMTLDGIVFDGGYRVNRGWDMKHHFGGSFKRSRVVKMVQEGIIEEAYPYVSVGVSPHTLLGASENRFDDVHVFSPGVINFTAHRVGTRTVQYLHDPSKGTQFPALDVSRNSYRNCSWGIADDASCVGLEWAYCDNNYFENCFIFTAGERRGKAFKITAPTSIADGSARTNPFTKSFPLMNTWVAGAWTGSWDVDSTWIPDQGGQGNRGITVVSINDGDAADPGYIGASTIPEHPAIIGITANGTQVNRRQVALLQGSSLAYTASVLGRRSVQLGVSGSTAVTQVYSQTLPARAFAAPNAAINTGELLWDRFIRLRWEGVSLNNTGTGQNFRLRVMSGSTVLFATPLVSVPSLAPYRAFRGECVLNAASITQLYASGSMVMADGGGSPTEAAEVWKQWVQTQTGIAYAGGSTLPLTIDIQHGSTSQITFLTAATVEVL